MKKVVLALLLISTLAQAQKRKTEVSIKDSDFYINNKITLKGKTYEGMQLEGLLPNSRMVQGIYDDLNPDTRDMWKYADTGKWDADRNTNEFIKAMPEWKKHGLLAFTLNLQGGSPQGYSQNQPWINSAFKADGSLDEAYMKRLEKILDKADQLSMVVMLGYFYFGQDERLKDEAAVINGVKNATNWLLDKNYRNVLVEVNNESNIKKYDHEILKEDRIHELVSLVKSMNRDGRRLLVSTSFGGGFIPVDNVLKVNDYVLVHGNGVKDPARIEEMVRIIKAKPDYKGEPIVFNEDDHFDFDKPYNNFIAATKAGASWGYFDYRMKDEGFVEGYQSMPADWGINSERKKGFFGLLKKMTK
jgi:hypothetical protein